MVCVYDFNSCPNLSLQLVIMILVLLRVKAKTFMITIMFRRTARGALWIGLGKIHQADLLQKIQEADKSSR